MTTDRTDSAAESIDNSSAVNRRAFLATTVGGSVAALAGCAGGSGGDGGEGEPTDGGSGGDDGSGSGSGGSTTTTGGSSKPFEGETLRVSTWSGVDTEMFREYVKPHFEEETGATLELVPGWSEVISKIKSAPADKPPYDVTVADGYVFQEGVNNDLFLPVRQENVPNAEELYPFLREFRDIEYGIPADAGPVALVYNSDLGWDPQEFEDLLSDQAKDAKVGMEGVWFQTPMMAAAIALQNQPGADEMYDEAERENVIRTLMDFDVDAWYEGAAQFWNMFENGIIEVGQFYFPNILGRVMNNDAYSFSLPAVTPAYLDSWCVVRGTDHRDLAEYLLNYLADAEVQTRWCNPLGAMASNQNMEYTRDVLKENYPTTNEEWEQIQFPKVPYLLEHYSEFSDPYKKIKAGQDPLA